MCAESLIPGNACENIMRILILLIQNIIHTFTVLLYVSFHCVATDPCFLHYILKDVSLKITVLNRT